MSEFDSRNELSESEFLSAFRRLSMPAELSNSMKQAGFILEHIEWYMDKNQLRVRDVFNYINRGENINLDQLVWGVEGILESLGVNKQDISRATSTLKRSDALSRRSRSPSQRSRERKKMSGAIPALISIPESFSRVKLNDVPSSGYGYGKINVKTLRKSSVDHEVEFDGIFSKSVESSSSTLPMLLTHSQQSLEPNKKLSIHSTRSQITNEKDFQRLVAASAKKYSHKLLSLDTVISQSLHRLNQDLSVRPGNSSCLTDGAYMKLV
jgi:hypothetical protein